MAILKNTPSPMTVGDYRKAALRHFNTCKVLWRYVNLPKESNLKKLPEEEILKNIFYLSGYVAECAIKYRYLTDCYALGDSIEESVWVSKSAKTKKHFTFTSTSLNDKAWSEIVIQNLCTSGKYVIPLYLQFLGGAVSISSSTNEEEMQASWEPTIRYNYSSNGLQQPPNITDIEAFFQATKDLLLKLKII
jgi:hypothetical protein